MKIFWKYCSHSKIFLTFILMFGYSFNGVLLSSIVLKASHFTNKSNIYSVINFGLWSMLMWVIIYVTNFFYSINVASMIKQVNIALKHNFFSIRFHEEDSKNKTSSTISNLTNDMKLMETNYLTSIFALYSNSLIFLVSLFYMIHLNLSVSVLFIVMSFLPMLVPKIFKRKMLQYTDEWSNSNSTLLNTFKDLLQGSLVLKTYNTEKSALNKSSFVLKDMEEKNYKLTKKEAEAELVASIFAGLSFITPFIVGCLLISLNIKISFATLLAIFLANDRVVGPLETIANLINKINSTQQLRKEMIKEPVRAKNNASKLKINNSYTVISSLRLVNIFYPLKNADNLHLNHVFKGNFKVLIQGPSGAGKTTILKIIQGSLTPPNGYVSITNEVGKNEEIADSIAYIDQNPYIFNSSIENNLTLFQNKAFSKKSLVQVLKSVSLFEELGGDKCLNLNCGENGDNLSGGQRQRIEIARALLRSKSLYLVDEATSNLDKANASKIRNILFRLDVPFIEVAHYINRNENRYTEKLKLQKGQLVNI